MAGSRLRALAVRARSDRRALWVAFALVHAALLVVGVLLVPDRAFWDLGLYRWWVGQGLADGRWPVLDDPWVYPAGALVPMLLAAVGGTAGGPGYALAWSLLVTALDAAALALLLRDPARGHPLAGHAGPRWHPSPAGAWWWVAFVAALGPVAMGRLDAVVAPLTVVALVLAARRPGVAAALLTAGAWVKVTPGALLLPLVLAVRRPGARVVAPAAAVCAVVVGAVAVLGGPGGLGRIATFLDAQDGRDLQLEAVVTTPWVLLGLVSPAVRRVYDGEIVTWEVDGPGTAVASAVMDLALVAGVALAAGLLLLARRRAGAAFRTRVVRLAFVVRGAMLLSLLLVVANKVGSPQYVGWLAAPVVVALTVGLPGWGRTAGLALVTAAATQVVFPWTYAALTEGAPLPTLLLAVRNALLVALLVETVRRLLAEARAAAAGAWPAAAAQDERDGDRDDERPGPGDPAGADADADADADAVSAARARPPARRARGGRGRPGPAPAGTSG
ncbi:glycosyltransferase 87 family protein [Cellulomonas endophytica]|uniref:glycosyltransferase 87 family protein n=1 Tax=Cellulomonas endophytica TaxID=2494735 RepID=UPI0010138D4D|nr:glycosyltransferase 87 family protein [Cellulomonas endophytica]